MTNKEPVFEKCSPKGMCTWLADRTECVEHAGKGFVAVHVLDLKTKPNEALTVFYGVKYKQARGDNGIMINHCPFCGQTPGQFAQEMKR